MGRSVAAVLPVLALSACVGDVDLYEAQGPRHEARAWLAGNPNPHPLASNRFTGRTHALAFVDSLYTLGADTVYVLNVREDSAAMRREGGPYADALLVRLPTDREARRRLRAVNARETLAQGFEPDPDLGRRYLHFFWD